MGDKDNSEKVISHYEYGKPVYTHKIPIAPLFRVGDKIIRPDMMDAMNNIPIYECKWVESTITKIHVEFKDSIFYTYSYSVDNIRTVFCEKYVRKPFKGSDIDSNKIINSEWGVLNK